MPVEYTQKEAVPLFSINLNNNVLQKVRAISSFIATRREIMCLWGHRPVTSQIKPALNETIN